MSCKQFFLSCKSEISDFISIIFDENIIWFNISMSDSVFLKIFQCMAYLTHNFNCLLLFNWFLPFKYILQSALIAKFKNNVDIFIIFIIFKYFKNKRTSFFLHKSRQLFKNIDFLVNLVFELISIFIKYIFLNNFDCDLLLSDRILSFKDSCKCSFSQFIIF